MVIDYVAVTIGFLKFHKFATLMVDVMFMKNIPLLIPMPSIITLVTVEHVPTHTAN